MAEAAEARDFELAAVYRDRLRALTYIQGSQTVHAEGLGDGDIFALASKAGQMCIQAFFIRGGQNWGHRSFFPAHTADVPGGRGADAASSMQFYEEVPPPRRILLDRDLPEAALIAEALCERAGHKVEISEPQRGARRKLIDQARRNAEEALERRMAETDHPGQAAARAGRGVRAARAAQADRGLRQQPHHGHQRDRGDDRRRARGLPQEQLPQVQHQVARSRPATISG